MEIEGIFPRPSGGLSSQCVLGLSSQRVLGESAQRVLGSSFHGIPEGSGSWQLVPHRVVGMCSPRGFWEMGLSSPRGVWR